jgi:hypothetical protein
MWSLDIWLSLSKVTQCWARMRSRPLDDHAGGLYWKELNVFALGMSWLFLSTLDLLYFAVHVQAPLPALHPDPQSSLPACSPCCHTGCCSSIDDNSSLQRTHHMLPHGWEHVLPHRSLSVATTPYNLTKMKSHRCRPGEMAIYWLFTRKAH